jgi:hypothetical protein
MGVFANSARFGDAAAASLHAVSKPDGGNRPGTSAQGPGGRELLGLGVATAVAVLLPLFLGIGVDALAHSSPVGLLLGLALGVTLASVTVFKTFKPYL